MIRTGVIFLIHLLEVVTNYSVGLFYAQWTHRYQLYLAGCTLIGVWTFVAFEVYGWVNPWRISPISFRGPYILHTVINLGLCLYVADELLLRLTGWWGRFENRTLGKQALIWGLSFVAAFYLQLTIVYEQIKY